MEKPMKGDVVVLTFPFSDLSSSKKRPALVVANLTGDDIILCEITSCQRNDNYSTILKNEDFRIGSLNLSSIARPNVLFTADYSIISYKIGSLKDNKIKEVEDKLVEIFREH